jgi:hypothetical protein
MDNAPREGILVPDKPTAAPPPAVIRPAPFGGGFGDDQRWRRLIPVFIASGALHVVLVGLFMLIDAPSNAQPIDTENTVLDTKVEEPQKPANLDNEEVGLDPDLPTNYDMPRIEQVSVPGPVNPSEAVGILNAPDGPPTNVPPPPGFGKGQGGGLDSPISGQASLQGFAGGLGGLKMMPGGFGGRSGATRERMVREGGGNGLSEAAVARGIHWMVAHQAPDGHWSLDGFHQHGHCNCDSRGSTSNDVAATAFGLLPMLGAGYTHRSVGKEAAYAKNVERGLKFLLFQQNREGAFNPDMYAHGLATIAVCEAFGLTSDPQLKAPAQRALNFIFKAQNGKGGWDYTPGGPTPDTSIGGWQIMAIKSGQMSGLEVPQSVISNATKWLNEWAGDADGSIYGYRQPRGRNPDEGGASPQSMIAIGLLCREYLGWGPRSVGLLKGAQWLLKQDNLPLPANRSHMYFHYYATQVMHHLGGRNWNAWNPLMRDWLIRTQDLGMTPGHPHQKGSWDSRPDWWCAYGGRVMMTSMCLLTLEVYYRHLPLYRRDMGGGK